MMLTVMAAAAFALALLPALLFLVNLGAYRLLPLGRSPSREPRGVSVLIPARNEEASIHDAVESALSNRDVPLEVLVLDDHSTDGTRQIVEQIAAGDTRVRVIEGPELPAGWCGKQHACSVLARHARYPFLVFVDADVRLAKGGLERMAEFLETSGAALASGFPRQETRTFLEKLLLPFMHFLLLGYLPVRLMRRSRWPAFGAGCGQLFIARKELYERSGGHASIRASLHDGVTLPRSFRRAGYSTDLFDATDIARCRMYRSAGEVWHGLSKNATEGLAHPTAILPWTLLLFGGHVLPFGLLGVALVGSADSSVGWLAAAGSVLALLPRWISVLRFRQSPWSAFLHPLGMLVLLAIQWSALVRALAGKPASWKGRTYGAGRGSERSSQVHPQPSP